MEPPFLLFGINLVRPSRLAKRRAPQNEDACAWHGLLEKVMQSTTHLILRCGAKRSLEGRTMHVPRTLLPAALAAMLALPASADDSGVWQGSYHCSQGETLLRLTIGPDKDGERPAHFYFYPRREAVDRSSGCFSMGGRSINSQPGWFLFSQKQWIKRPENYVMVDMIGKIDTDGGFEGRVVGPGCSRFKLQRVLDRPDFSDSCTPFVN
jgi:hypothetical protein